MPEPDVRAGEPDIAGGGIPGTGADGAANGEPGAQANDLAATPDVADVSIVGDPVDDAGVAPAPVAPAPPAIPPVVDVTDRANLVAALTPYPHLDVVVAGAGIAKVAPFEAITDDDFNQIMKVNLYGVFVTLQEGIRRMEQGGRTQPYSVIAFTKDGKKTVFAKH